MPGFDGTGPRGMGPMTGGGRGYCAVPLKGGAGGQYFPSRSFGRGRGRGRRYWFKVSGMQGWARAQREWPDFGMQPEVYPAGMTAEQELEGLKQEAESLKTELKDVQSRIDSLEKGRDLNDNG